MGHKHVDPGSHWQQVTCHHDIKNIKFTYCQQCSLNQPYNSGSYIHGYLKKFVSELNLINCTYCLVSVFCSEHLVVKFPPRASIQMAFKSKHYKLSSEHI